MKVAFMIVANTFLFVLTCAREESGYYNTRNAPGETLAMNQIFREQKVAVGGGGGEGTLCS